MKSIYFFIVLLCPCLLPAQDTQEPAPLSPPAPDAPAAFKPFPEARTYIPHPLTVAPFTPPLPPGIREDGLPACRTGLSRMIPARKPAILNGRIGRYPMSGINGKPTTLNETL
jgi:hypothetical protein